MSNSSEPAATAVESNVKTGETKEGLINRLLANRRQVEARLSCESCGARCSD